MRIDKFLQKLLTDNERELKERVFVVLTLVSTFVCGLALIGDILVGENIVETITLIITMIAVPGITYIGIRTKRINLATRIISFGLILVIIPVVFYFGGGVEGAVIPWMIFAYLYIGLVLSGAWRVSALVIHSIVVVSLFVLEYHFPGIKGDVERHIRYIDVVLAVVEVGYVCFVMTWFQNLLYEEQNRMTMEEAGKVEEMSRSRNLLFSNMSHEIRTPINSILGLNEVILRQPDASEEIIRDSRNIEGAGRMLLALINDILDFSKIEAGRMDIVPVNYSIAGLLSEIVNMVLHRAEEKGLKFNVELDPSIPSELYGDEIRIKQILINLLNNAVKYTREGEITLHIENESEEDDSVVLIFSVIDTGMGIKQEVIPYLFDAFKRADEDKTIGIEGTGLGLSIVKQLVDLMGGRITVDSVYTQGSTFTVTLRQKISRSDAVGSFDITGYGKSSRSVTYEAGFTARDARILIVDDNRMNLEVERKLLEGTGITVDTASGGEEALALTLAEHYDIILMDHLMPGMDGIECMQHIRRQSGGLNNRVPVIALTANAGSDMRELYRRSGFEDYLLKPVSGQALEEMIISHIPSFKITMNDESHGADLSVNTKRDYIRKLPIIITCAGTCDLPAHIIRKYQIDTIPYTVQFDGKEFYDGVEATGDELIRYIKEGRQFFAFPPTVEEYRIFFGQELRKAHYLIYISAASGISPEYDNAFEAAKSYDNVTVIDSRGISCSVGLLALTAQTMAIRGDSYEKILEQLERAKLQIRACFVTDSTFLINGKGRIREGLSRFAKALGLRCFISYSNGKFGVEKVCTGDFDKICRKYIDHSLGMLRGSEIDTIMIVYSNLTREQRDMMETYISSKKKCSKIVFRRTGAVLPIYSGPEAFGLAYFADWDRSLALAGMFDRDEPEHDEPEYDEPEHEVIVEHNEAAIQEAVRELKKPVTLEDNTENAATGEEEDMGSNGKWYESIDGIDPEIGIKNSASEDMFATLLQIFYDSIDENRDEICGLFEKEEWKNYTVKVHALKSTCLLIGAKELADKALALELAGKGDDIEFIKNNHQDCMDHLESFREPLKRAIETREGNADAGAEPSADAAGEPAADANEGFDRFLLESIYEALRDGAESRDDDMITETFSEASEYELPKEDTDKISELKRLHDMGRYRDMISVIDGE